MVDRYTKLVLTVIAVCLVWLCLWGPGPKWGTPAEAADETYVYGTVDVNIVEVAGKKISRYSPKVPADVQGTVEVEGTVTTCEVCAD